MNTRIPFFIADRRPCPSVSSRSKIRGFLWVLALTATIFFGLPSKTNALVISDVSPEPPQGVCIITPDNDNPLGEPNCNGWTPPQPPIIVYPNFSGLISNDPTDDPSPDVPPSLDPGNPIPDTTSTPNVETDLGGNSGGCSIGLTQNETLSKGWVLFSIGMMGVWLPRIKKLKGS